MATDKVTKAPEGGELAPFTVIDEVARWLTEPDYVIPWPVQGPASPEQAAAMSAEINQSILDAEDPFSDGDASMKLEDALGLSFQLLGVEFRPSDPSSGADIGGTFAIIRGVTIQGETVVLITGSEKVLTRCVAAVRRNGLGRWVKVQKGERKTSQGRDVYDLVAGDEPFPAA